MRQMSREYNSRQMLDDTESDLAGAPLLDDRSREPTVVEMTDNTRSIEISRENPLILMQDDSIEATPEVANEPIDFTTFYQAQGHPLQ
jgi:hypothetical protein